MKPRVELIYDRDCPNAGEARAALLQAFASAGMAASWTEWERTAADSPTYARDFGSPTILIDGQDVAGGRGSSGGASCRIYPNEKQTFRRTPSVNMIRMALAKSSRNASPKNLLLALPGVGTLFAPLGACPVCWPIYTSLLASAGLGFLTRTAYLLPLSVTLLALALTPLACRAKRTGRYQILAIGIGGAALALIGKFMVTASSLLYLGLVLLVGASVWNWRSATAAAALCPNCAPKFAAGPLSGPGKEKQP